MDQAAKLAFARRIRDISTSCYDLGAAERMRLLAEELETSGKRETDPDAMSDCIVDARRSSGKTK
jgi:hypothetical protein